MILGPIAIFVAVAAVFLQAKHYERHGELFAQKAVCRAAVTACSLSPTPPSCASAGEVVRDVFNLTPPSGFIFPHDVASLAQELVSIPSPSGAEHGAGRYIAAWLTARGWDVGTPAVGGGRDPAGRFNVVALPPGVGDTTAVRVLLSTHFDTVPLSDREPRLTESRLYGRGSVDAKGLLASMLVAAQELVSKGDGSGDAAAAPVGLLFVCGEETDHAGMMAANDLGFRSDVVIVNGEPTTGKLCVGQKGMLKLQIEATGVACHSGYPELGSSAIEALLDVLAAIRGVDWPVDHETGAATTLNIGVLNGGSARKFRTACGPASPFQGLSRNVTDSLIRKLLSLHTASIASTNNDSPAYDRNLQPTWSQH
jgi:acetylornithine deacetylase/succinyl-diaminopimelate desuccinylase-like protein